MLLIALLACAAEPASPVLPAADGPLAPSSTVFRNATGLADVERCAACHPEQAAGWATSAHAHASFDNPWYRASVEAVRDEVGRTASRHCAGCHDPVLLATGAIEQRVDPADPRARVGVTCLTCHGTVAATTEGNGSYTLDLRDVPYPAEGELDGPVVEAHRARLLPEALVSGAVCGTCHRGFLDARTGNATFLTGLDDLGSHAGSASRGSHARRLDPTPAAPAGCIDCHLDGHRFPGGQTALAARAGQLDAVVAILREAVTVHVVARADGPDLVVDAIVHNTGTGHAYPGGLADAQDSWLSLVVDGTGVALGDPGDPGVHRVRAEVLDEAGRPERRHRAHRIGVVAWDHRVDAGDARVFRTVIIGGADAEAVHVELRHRPHPGELHAAGCAVSTDDTLSGCVEMPETVIATASTTVGEPGSFEAAYAHGLGLLHQVSERLDEARAPLQRARALAPDDRSRAAALVLLAQLEGRQERTAEALRALDEAEVLVGDHPAIQRARADALAEAWRWEEAAAAYARLTASAPADTATWRDLARARVSADDPAGALRATAEGLARAPRDPDLLRQQALALTALDDPAAEGAWAAWEAHRRRDDAADRRLRCDQEVAGCAEERAPVPVKTVR